mmetsp:Transcript_47710/g.102203  ORF Transcript_47710/g.102203 Transcript_47710/m.102203 type:complete len:415 (-) Transcript_47710:1306-2550(-)
MLLDCQRIVGSTLDCGVIGHEEHLAAMHEANASHDARRMCPTVVHLKGCQRRQLKELRAGVHDGLDSLARQHLSALAVLANSLLSTTSLGDSKALVQLLNERRVMRFTALEVLVLSRRCHLQARSGRARARLHTLLGSIPDRDRVQATLSLHRHGVAPVRLARLVLRNASCINFLDRRIHDEQLLAGGDCLVRCNCHGFHDTIMRCVHLGLELHGGQEHHYIALLHLCARRSNHLHNSGFDWSRNANDLLASLDLARRGSSAPGRGRSRGSSSALAVSSFRLLVQLLSVADHEGEENLVVHELGMVEDVAVEVLVRVDALKVVAVQSIEGPFSACFEGLLTFTRGEADEFADQWVVVHARSTTLVESCVDSNTLASGLDVLRDLWTTARGQRDSALDGEAPQRGGRVALAPWEP